VAYLETAPGVRLFYEDFGEGHPIVFTHPGLATHSFWQHQTAVLAHEYRTVTYDWRGVGRSDRPRSGYTLRALTDDLLALIEKLELGRVTLVTHGVGTHPVLSAYLRRPELVARLVLISGAPRYGGADDGDGGLSEEFSKWLAKEMDSSGRVCAQAYANLYDRYLFRSDQGPAVAQWFLNMALESPLYVVNAYLANMKGTDFRDQMDRITCPVMIAQARHDRKQRYEGAVYLSKHLPNAKLVTFEHSSHMPHIEEMARFNEELRAFVKQSETQHATISA
jgi:non-heme chloroperoxidase